MSELAMPEPNLDEDILTLTDIEAVYNEVMLVLKGMSLSVKRQSVTALLGANGAGKSTTLKCISGLMPSERGAVVNGSIKFEGEDITQLGAEKIVQRGLFQVMEGRRIIQDMTVVENLKLGAFTRKDRQNIKKDIDRVFEYFPRLAERTGLAGYLSGGEQQMLAIGRALMARPKLILMDEPSMGLSPRLVKEVFGIIQKLNEELGLSILLVEQNAKMALGAAHFGYVMEQGKSVLNDSAETLVDHEDIKEFYLGGGGEERRSFKNLKSFKRRKSWV